MQGPIWESASFPPDTGSNTYLFVAVLFFVDKNLRDRAPRVWGDLNVTCDSNSGCPLEGNQYGMTRAMVPFYSGDFTVMEVSMPLVDPTLTASMRIWPGLLLDLAMSDQCNLLG